MFDKLLIAVGLKSKQPDWDNIPILIAEALSAHAENQDIAQISASDLGPVLRDVNWGRATWELQLRDGRRVAMSVSGTTYLNDENFVVFVSASKFYAVWWALREFDRRGICEFEQMPKNRKYGCQDDIWARSDERPVPLADVSYHEGYGIGFIDGITRTLWLLYNGASSFPVKVHGVKAAHAMHSAIGDERFKPVTVESLMLLDKITGQHTSEILA
jgi:hypothetical protein